MMIDLDKFYRERIPRFRLFRAPYFAEEEHKILVQAFSQCYKALKDERERCAKVAEKHLDECDGQFCEEIIAKKIREGEK